MSASLSQTTGRSAGLDAAAGDDAMDILPRASRVHARKLVSDAPAVADRSSFEGLRNERTAARDARLGRFAGLLTSGLCVVDACRQMGIHKNRGSKYLAILRSRGFALDISAASSAAKGATRKALNAQRRAAALSSHEVRRERKAEKTTRRNCLRCEKEFPSWGAGNRMCDYCRVHAE